MSQRFGSAAPLGGFVRGLHFTGQLEAVLLVTTLSILLTVDPGPVQVHSRLRVMVSTWGRVQGPGGSARERDLPARPARGE